MQILKRIKFSFLSALCISLLCSCTSTKDKIFKDDSRKTMTEIYQAKFGSTGKDVYEYPVYRADPNYTGHSSESKRELDTLFKPAPNPILMLYVFPHLTSEGLPVPGYSTQFYMYKENGFLLPGE